MKIARRRLLQAVALAGVPDTTLDAQDAAVTVEALRGASLLNGKRVPDNRLEVVKPLIERRQDQLEALRKFEVDDLVGPTQGILV